MTQINVFYQGLLSSQGTTIDYSITIDNVEGGVVVNSSEKNLLDEFFPVESTEEFIQEYGVDYLPQGVEGEDYEIVKGED